MFRLRVRVKLDSRFSSGSIVIPRRTTNTIVSSSSSSSSSYPTRNSSQIAGVSAPSPAPAPAYRPPSVVPAAAIVDVEARLKTTTTTATTTATTPIATTSCSVQANFKSLLNAAASNVWIITGSDGSGHPIGFTSLSVTSVSTSPPMISFRIPRNEISLPGFTKTLTFAAHLLAQTQVSVAPKFCTSARFEDRWLNTNEFTWDAQGLPNIPNSLGRITGQIQTIQTAGESVLAIGTVTSASFSPSVGLPLVHQNGQFHANLPLGSSSAATGTAVIPSSRKKQIHLNAFDMTCVGHQSPGLWRHPEDRGWQYKNLSYWTDLARLLDSAGFDSLFIADVLGTYDVYKGSHDAALRTAAQVPVNDPLFPITAMAAVTTRLGFGATVSLTYEQPYSFARKMSTLDHLTDGRIAWNIVTSYLQSAAVNLGLNTQIEHDTRYEIADEFMDVCYKLWEGSWQQNAVIRDRTSGVFTVPERVHKINHHGKYYQVPGIHLCEPSPQRTPTIYQAGASKRGQQFAAKHSEGMFIIGVSPEALRKTVDDVRIEATRQGRNPRGIKVFAAITVITDVSDEAAQTKYKELQKYASVDGALALYGGWTGVDLSKVDLDAPLSYTDNDSLRTVGEMFTKADPTKVWTPRLVAEFLGVGGIGPVIVGGAKRVVDEMERWMDVADLDGFNIVYAITPGTFQDFVTYIIPELRARGRHLTEEQLQQQQQAQQGRTLTLRERVHSEFGSIASATLAADHPGAHYRRQLQLNAK